MFQLPKHLIEVENLVMNDTYLHADSISFRIVYPSVRETLKHGKLYKRLEMFMEEYMNYSLKNIVSVRETGTVIQPNLYWLAASPDGLVFDNFEFGLIEIKCPYSKREWTPEEMLQDKKFYVKLFEEKPILKQGRSSGYILHSNSNGYGTLWLEIL